MVIERFKDAPAIYKRLGEKGRMMPEGLNYVSSWIDNWKDLMEFEIIPVRTSAEAVERMSAKF